MSEVSCKVWLERDEKLLRLRLNRPKANIIDTAMIAALQKAFDQYAENTALRGILLDAEGLHFSFGASVEEHLPDSFATMLRALHQLVGTMLDFPVPILVAIRGQCLGGGLEVVCAASQLFASPDAAMGQPEIQLAVFAPAASCLLPQRIGRGQAEDLLFSGRSIKADEAFSMGLINAIADDPEKAALDYFDKHLAPRSASSLRFAVQAVRGDLSLRIKARLAEVESLYTGGLMNTRDAVEGLTAFIEKRPPRWEEQ
jgi:cyclohexa-1,5-dienecarbonyl-CoA hydratase